MRSTEIQVSPQFMKPPQTAALDAISRSASARTIMASLPPSSRTDGINFLAQASAMRWPVETLPVKRTLSGPASMIAAPLQHLHQARRKFCLCDEFADQLATPWCEFGGFEQHRVARRERGDYLRHGNRERIIPRRDNRDDAQRIEFEPAGFRFHGDVVVRHAFGTEPARGLAR